MGKLGDMRGIALLFDTVVTLFSVLNVRLAAGCADIAAFRRLTLIGRGAFGPHTVVTLFPVSNIRFAASCAHVTFLVRITFIFRRLRRRCRPWPRRWCRTWLWWSRPRWVRAARRLPMMQNAIAFPSLGSNLRCHPWMTDFIIVPRERAPLFPFTAWVYGLDGGGIHISMLV